MKKHTYMEEWVVEKHWEIGIGGNMYVEVVKSFTECARGAVMLDGKISQ